MSTRTILPLNEHFDITIDHPTEVTDPAHHVACLVYKGDQHCSHPLVVVHLNPYANTSDGVEHRVYRPDIPQDGLNSMFEDAVSKWAKENYPMVPDKVYTPVA